MRTEALAAEVGLTTRGTEDRLRRTRGKLESRTTVEADRGGQGDPVQERAAQRWFPLGMRLSEEE